MTSIGPYTIEKTLGSGGFGTVYRCVHERLGWVRAIKVIHDPDLMDSIVEEARVVSELSHPNIVHLYDLDHRATPPYAVFEFVDGTDLAKRLRQGPLPWQEAVRIATEVLAALACAHEHGVIHRDVKPSNILLARDGAVKLSDFGLGRIAELQTRLRVSRQSAPVAPPSQMQQSRQGEVPAAPRMGAGTPFYMSPQQRRGEDPQAADDIYSLGVVLYEALTGYLPEGAWPAPSEVAEVPEALDAVVRRALALRREDRFASAEEMRAALLNLNVPMVTCPECGAQRPEDADDQFTCLQCGREHLCVTHLDLGTGLCWGCVNAGQTRAHRVEEKHAGRQAPVFPSHPRIEPVRTRSWAVPAAAVLAVVLTLGGVGTCMGVAFLNRQAQLRDRTDMNATVLEEQSDARQGATDRTIEDTATAPAPDQMVAPQSTDPDQPSDSGWPPSPGSYAGQEIVGPAGITFVWVPSGSSMMGTEDGANDEGPIHRVELTGFWVGKTEVTVGQWRAVMGAVPTSSQTDKDRPAGEVSWEAANQFCARIGVELPTEAQWEYAARGPEGRRYPWGDAWDAGKCCNRDNRAPDDRTFPAGSLPEGASWCGALDMAGNVWEWCADWYAPDYYGTSPIQDPPGPETGSTRVHRGGSWESESTYCRSTDRHHFAPSFGVVGVGFRVAKS